MAANRTRIKRLETADINTAAEIEALRKRTFGVQDWAGLLAAYSETGTGREYIYILKNITAEAMIALAAAQTLDGNGKTIADTTLDASQYMAMQISAADVIVEDLTMAISGTSEGNALYGIDVYAASSTIQDCTLAVTNAGSKGSVAIYYEGYSGHILKDNALANGVALTGNVSFDDISGNTFAATKGFGLGECTIGGYHYHEASPTIVEAIKAYLIARGNSTTGEASGLVVEGYYE